MIIEIHYRPFYNRDIRAIEYTDEAHADATAKKLEMCGNKVTSICVSIFNEVDQ